MKVLKIDDCFYMVDGDSRVALTPNEDRYLKLPINSTGRVWVSCAKVEKAEGQCVDYGEDVKTPRVLGPRDNSTPRKKLEDYLTDDEKATIEAIMNRAKERKEADKPKPMTEIEKAEAKLAKLTARLEALKAAKAAKAQKEEA